MTLLRTTTIALLARAGTSRTNAALVGEPAIWTPYVGFTAELRADVDPGG